MSAVKDWLERHPVSSFVLLSYGITWTVWLSIPAFVGEAAGSSRWALVKVLTGVGLGPGLAAVLLDRWRGTGGAIGSGAWWRVFSIVFGLVATVDLSILFTGDAPGNAGFASMEAPGPVPAGVIGSLLAAGVCGFIFACAATSRARELSSILALRAPLRWWLVALFLPAGMALLSLAVALIRGEALPPLPAAGLPMTTWLLFFPRSILFTLLVVTVGEEPGWRGFLLPELQKRFSPLVSSLGVGLVWGLWHLPLFVNGLYPGGPRGIVTYLILCPTLAVIFTWLYNRSGGVLLLALVLHMAVNNTGRFLPSAPSVAWLGVALAAVLVIAERMWKPLPKPSEATP